MGVGLMLMSPENTMALLIKASYTIGGDDSGMKCHEMAERGVALLEKPNDSSGCWDGRDNNVGVASKPKVPIVLLRLVRCAVLVPFVIVMSHAVMSVPGNAVPVAPFVVIDPVTVYGFVTDG
jgi:hypothetical protein